jgi:hypothetical protein
MRQSDHQENAPPTRLIRDRIEARKPAPAPVPATPPAPAAPARDVEAELAIKVRNSVKTAITTLSGKYKREPGEVARLLIAACAEFTTDAGEPGDVS